MTNEDNKANDNTVYVGPKPPMNYVLAVITQFQNGAEVVNIEARCKAISRAVDVTEIIKNKFMESIKTENITTGTEELQSREGRNTKVSLISISLRKP